MIRWSRAGSLLLVAASLGACGSSGTSGSGGTTGGIPSVCPAYATAICNLYASCSNGWYVSAEYGDQAACVASYELSCAERLAAPGTALTTADILSCSQGLPTESCGALYGNNPEEVCAAPAGKTPLNGPCEVAAQCASAYCAIPSNAFCGTCQPTPTTGASCSQFGCPGAAVPGRRADLRPGGSGRRSLQRPQRLPVRPDLPQQGQDLRPDRRRRPALRLYRQGWPRLQRQPGPGLPANRRRRNVRAEGARRRRAAVWHVERQRRGHQLRGPRLLSETGRLGVGTCLAAAANGEPCDTANGPDCQLPARCIITGGGTSGTCALLGSAVCNGDAGPVVDAGPGDGEFFAMGTFTAAGRLGAVSANLTGIESTLGMVAAGPSSSTSRPPRAIPTAWPLSRAPAASRPTR